MRLHGLRLDANRRQLECPALAPLNRMAVTVRAELETLLAPQTVRAGLGRQADASKRTYCSASAVPPLIGQPQPFGLMLQVDPVHLLKRLDPNEVLLHVMTIAPRPEILHVPSIPAGMDVTDLGARRLIPW